MRHLSIDLGDKRTGIAVGDDESGLISPVDVITQPRGEPLLAALLKSIEEHAPKAIVIGLPLNMDGSEGPASKSIRAFAAQLQQRTPLPVHFQDERLTSYAADQHMAQSGRTHKQKKSLRDALAAAEILKDFFESKPSREA